MRTPFHAELDELITDLATKIRFCAALMTNASTALHQGDLPLAELVITEGDQMTGMLKQTQRRCHTLLALQAPVATDLRVIVAAVHTVDHLRRMSKLAQHIAMLTRLKHPNPLIPDEARAVCARMGLLASQLATEAAAAIQHRDPLSSDRLAQADDEVDALRRCLFGILFTPD